MVVQGLVDAGQRREELLAQPIGRVHEPLLVRDVPVREGTGRALAIGGGVDALDLTGGVRLDVLGDQARRIHRQVGEQLQTQGVAHPVEPGTVFVDDDGVIAQVMSGLVVLGQEGLAVLVRVQGGLQRSYGSLEPAAGSRHIIERAPADAAPDPAVLPIANEAVGIRDLTGLLRRVPGHAGHVQDAGGGLEAELPPLFSGRGEPTGEVLDGLVVNQDIVYRSPVSWLQVEGQLDALAFAQGGHGISSRAGSSCRPSIMA